MALTKVKGLGLGTLDDNITFSTAGKGVHLGVTSATASNLIDDYEEGTWTPTNVSSNHFHTTVSVTNANYTKVGRQVECNFQINMASSSGNVATDSYFLLAGFPFTLNSSAVGSCFISTDPTSGGYASGSIAIFNNGTFAYVNFGSVINASIPRSNHITGSVTYFTN
jgi:hypothetical protein